MISVYTPYAVYTRIGGTPVFTTLDRGVTLVTRRVPRLGDVDASILESFKKETKYTGDLGLIRENYFEGSMHEDEAVTINLRVFAEHAGLHVYGRETFGFGRGFDARKLEAQRAGGIFRAETYERILDAPSQLRVIGYRSSASVNFSTTGLENLVGEVCALTKQFGSSNVKVFCLCGQGSVIFEG
ncbi:MAG: hypothetical protein M1357_03165 [Candidatus Marsarchaeota archaeon]|nr:hypothetical protein [Candidatus Marsarchaeota archaeon]